MSEHVEPCYHGGAKAHEFSRGCPGHPHTGLIPEVSDFLDRLNANEPEALTQLNRLWGNLYPKAEPLIPPDEMREINRQIEEGQRIRAQGAASGANYLIGSAAAPRDPQ